MLPSRPWVAVHAAEQLHRFTFLSRAFDARRAVWPEKVGSRNQEPERTVQPPERLFNLLPRLGAQTWSFFHRNVQSKGISTAANWWLIQRLSATSPQKNGRALSDRKYPKDVYVARDSARQRAPLKKMALKLSKESDCIRRYIDYTVT